MPRVKTELMQICKQNNPAPSVDLLSSSCVHKPREAGAQALLPSLLPSSEVAESSSGARTCQLFPLK